MQSRGGKIQVLCNAYRVRQESIHPSILVSSYKHYFNKLIVLTHQNDSYNDGWQHDTGIDLILFKRGNTIDHTVCAIIALTETVVGPERVGDMVRSALCTIRPLRLVCLLVLTLK